MFLLTLKRLLVLPLALVAGFAQDNPADTKPKSENGSIILDLNGGWSFGFPAVRASVSTSAGSAISPEKTALPAYGFDANVRVWKFFVPFFELSAIDTGKATASVGAYQATAQANTYALNGGIRFESDHGRIRPYARFGGGTLRQTLSGTFSAGSSSTGLSGSGSAGEFMYGGGVRSFLGKHWGVDIGFDGYHVSQPLNGAGQNYSRLHFGWFLQSKSSVE
jgi:hypothetical protein